ncbi:bifunctional response regulator/alkaline phosphatase family protein [Thermophagus xiamenensis]|uniref:Response regulator receiver domain-containing protein n=1 Tax=Thermophagus xiamenensis TaxID=385682 RepID=A0A1I1YBE4_9BACT|nr:bifunctional response regulator/alkaline phosphatase family protein [Thermophagus xiamenensis]SFE15423.1 Response regulator receiver domain-containing protein [Thermophagus xiamenensis]
MEEIKKIRILWIDDEIEHLKAHVIFLQQKGFLVDTASNGNDALNVLKENHFDLVFLDENMPGLSGLETLIRIKEIRPGLPVIMITKNEEEDIMDQAIGSKITDYLIKPVKPTQILSSIKRHVHRDRLVSQKATSDYQAQFSDIGFRLSDNLSMEEWQEVYRKLVYWELELQNADSPLDEVLKMQKREANQLFARTVKNNYENWLLDGDGPLMSHRVLKNYILPLLDKGQKVVLIVIDNFRLDQWETIRNELTPFFDIADDNLYCSILPTATQYARNALFSGLLPLQIQELYPNLWTDEDEEGGRNQYEEELIGTFMKRMRRSFTYSYHKISDSDAGKKLVDNFRQLNSYDLNVIVFNFIDMLSHARTELKMIRELASDESAYRSLTRSWFVHSSLYELFKKLSEAKNRIVLTSDHGSIRVQHPLKVIGDRNTNTNLRFKQGKNLDYNAKEVYEVKRPESIFLPRINVSTSYIFAKEDDFFAYPNNYNYYVNYYKDSFQHGGISLEEMLIPLVELVPL